MTTGVFPFSTEGFGAVPAKRLILRRGEQGSAGRVAGRQFHQRNHTSTSSLTARVQHAEQGESSVALPVSIPNNP